jgi:hypothetical protein
MHKLVLLALVLTGPVQDVSPLDKAGIRIINTGGSRPMSPPTEINGGPAVGDMLNNHYFPGLQDYAAGMYSYAVGQMTFVINHPVALDGNPNGPMYYSTAHYIRGMVYLHHATGVGRHRLAKADFEAAIKWYPKNYMGYIELARLYSQLELKAQALAVLHLLLSLGPDAATAAIAQRELKALEGSPEE